MQMHTRSGLECEGRADLVRSSVVRAVELCCVERETEGSLDTWAESLCVAQREHTSVVDLRLDERSRVEVSNHHHRDQCQCRCPKNVILTSW